MHEKPWFEQRICLCIFWRCCGAAALSIFWLLRSSFIFREFVYILAATEEFYLQREFVYTLALLRGSIYILYIAYIVYILAVTEEQLSSATLSTFWCHCEAASFVYIPAVTEERLSSVTFAYNLALLRGSILCLYSGCYGGASVFPDFVYILAPLRGSSLCLYSGCYGGAAVFCDFVYFLVSLRGSSLCLYSGSHGGVYLQRINLYSGFTAGQQPLSIFWLLRRSLSLDN